MQRPSGGTGKGGAVQVAGPWVSKPVHFAGGSRMCGSRAPGTTSKAAGSHKVSPPTSMEQRKTEYMQFKAAFSDSTRLGFCLHGHCVRGRRATRLGSLGRGNAHPTATITLCWSSIANMIAENDVASSVPLMAPWDVLTFTCAKVADGAIYLTSRRRSGSLYIYIYPVYLSTSRYIYLISIIF